MPTHTHKYIETRALSIQVRRCRHDASAMRSSMFFMIYGPTPADRPTDRPTEPKKMVTTFKSANTQPTHAWLRKLRLRAHDKRRIQHTQLSRKALDMRTAHRQKSTTSIGGLYLCTHNEYKIRSRACDLLALWLVILTVCGWSDGCRCSLVSHMLFLVVVVCCTLRKNETSLRDSQIKYKFTLYTQTQASNVGLGNRRYAV